MILEVQRLRFALDRQQQNAFYSANNQAQTAELIRRLSPDAATTA